jgi:hypothetical protein
VDLTSPAAALLLALLVGAGALVTYVPGRVVERMIGAFTGEGKTDTRDARASQRAERDFFGARLRGS